MFLYYSEQPVVIACCIDWVCDECFAIQGEYSHSFHLRC